MSAYYLACKVSLATHNEGSPRDSFRMFSVYMVAQPFSFVIPVTKSIGRLASVARPTEAPLNVCLEKSSNLALKSPNFGLRNPQNSTTVIGAYQV